MPKMYYIITPNWDECIMYIHKNAFNPNARPQRELTYIKENAIKFYDKELAYKYMRLFNETHEMNYSTFVVFME